MRVTAVSVSYARTFNLGDYNNARFECSVNADVEEGETAEEVQAALWEIAKASVKAAAMPVVARRNAEVEAIKASIPELNGAN